jgi:Cu/Ag efflux protein CusF
MQRISRTVEVVAAICLLLACTAFAQNAQKKSYTFHGKVEKVNESAKTLTVNGEEVKGWMAAMTMDYSVDDAGVLKKVKAGDQITATVYDNDYVLYKIQVAPKH